MLVKQLWAALYTLPLQMDPDPLSKKLISKDFLLKTYHYQQHERNVILEPVSCYVSSMIMSTEKRKLISRNPCRDLLTI